jgi:hypothetical protein
VVGPRLAPNANRGSCPEGQDLSGRRGLRGAVVAAIGAYQCFTVNSDQTNYQSLPPCMARTPESVTLPQGAAIGCVAVAVLGVAVSHSFVGCEREDVLAELARLGVNVARRRAQGLTILTTGVVPGGW